MKIKNKKIVIGTIGTLLVSSLPLATIISCGEKKSTTNSHFLEKFTATIDKNTFEKDGWGKKKHFLKMVQDKDSGKKISVLSDEFVDYLVKKVNEVDLTKDHKVFYMNLRSIGMDGLGEYFTKEMSKIKIETKEYHLKEWASKYTKSIKGTSGILLNIGDNLFTSGFSKEDKHTHFAKDEIEIKMLKLMREAKSIRGVIYNKWDWGYVEEPREWPYDGRWLVWTLNRIDPGFAANWAIRYKSK